MASDTSLVRKAGVWGHQGVVLLTTGEVMHKNPPGGLQRGRPGDALPPSLRGGGPSTGEWTPQSQLNQWVLWVTLSSSPPPLVSWLSHP